MSTKEKLAALWDRLKGKGPAAAVSLTLDLGVARENKPFSLEAGGLIVERCDGNLYARIDGPNGDALNLYKIRSIRYPFSTLYLTNAAQSGLSARLLVLPTGLDVQLSAAPKSEAWTTQDLAVEEQWIVPAGEVREFFVFILATASVYDLNARVIAQNMYATGVWFPAQGVAYWDATAAAAIQLVCQSPHGYEMSGGEGLYLDLVGAVRWRRSS